MFNKIVLVGHLTRDIELRYTQGGAAIGSSGIAVTRKYTLNGEKREETCFIDITFFGKPAEIANQYLNKGSKLLVEGRLKFDQWQDSNGQNRSKHSVVVEVMEMLGDAQGGSNSQNQGGYGGSSKQNQRSDAVGGVSKRSEQNQSYQSNNHQTNYDDRYDSDETIPF